MRRMLVLATLVAVACSHRPARAADELARTSGITAGLGVGPSSGGTYAQLDARFWTGLFQAGVLAGGHATLFGESVTGVAATVGIAYRPVTKFSIDALLLAGQRNYFHVGSGGLLGPPGANGDVPYAGFLAGFSGYAGRTWRFEYGGWLLFDADLDQKDTTYTYAPFLGTSTKSDHVRIGGRGQVAAFFRIAIAVAF